MCTAPRQTLISWAPRQGEDHTPGEIVVPGDGYLCVRTEDAWARTWLRQLCGDSPVPDIAMVTGPASWEYIAVAEGERYRVESHTYVVSTEHYQQDSGLLLDSSNTRYGSVPSRPRAVVWYQAHQPVYTGVDVYQDAEDSGTDREAYTEHAGTQSDTGAVMAPPGVARACCVLQADSGAGAVAVRTRLLGEYGGLSHAVDDASNSHTAGPAAIIPVSTLSTIKVTQSGPGAATLVTWTQERSLWYPVGDSGGA